MPTILDGVAVAARVRADLRADVDAFRVRTGRPPCLRVVLVGEHPASASYVRGKTAAAAEIGIDADTLRHPSTMPEADLLALVARLNEDDGVDGILVQLPLPDHIATARVIEAVRPSKDVDGFHPENAGRIAMGSGGLAPCTPAGVVELLKRSGIETRGRHAVIVGRSNIVGRPLASILASRPADATVTVCHSATPDLGAFTRLADILVAAVGQPGIITGAMVREGAVVIDVGINRVDDPTRERGYRLVGDVDFASVAPRASAITPVPGGVGPMTIALLLKNTVEAANARLGPAR